MNVEEVMSSEPRFTAPSTPIRDVLQLLWEADIRHLPIVDGELLIGIVSERDLRALIPSGLMYGGYPHEIQRMLDQPINDVMTPDPISVPTGTGLQRVVDLMIENRIGAVPVVEAGSPKLVGIVSYVDALRAARAFL